MTRSGNLYVCVSQSTIVYSILDHLGASDSASFMHAFGIRHTTFLRKKYMDPLRDLGTFSDWINDKKMHGIKILIMGVDVRRWMDRIKKPWCNSWKRPYPITIWPAVVAVDGSTCVDELKNMHKDAIEAKDISLCEDIDHSLQIIGIMLGINSMVESKLICPTRFLTGNNMGSNNWSFYRCDDMHANDIAIMLHAGYVSDSGPMTVCVNHYNDRSQHELRSDNMFLIETVGRNANEPIDVFEYATRHRVPWYDLNTRKIKTTTAYSMMHSMTGDMTERHTDEEFIEIMIKVPTIRLNWNGHQMYNTVMARVPVPGMLE
jgi:hypothetical protein